MNCPRGHGPLVKENLYGIEVDRCSSCHGVWLDTDELGELEATGAPNENDRRGMIEYSKRASEMVCPKCSARMVAFDYRANSLELDACEEDHGYWLDGGEDGRVRELIEQRVRDLYRAQTAEASWGQFMDGLRGIKGKVKR